MGTLAGNVLNQEITKYKEFNLKLIMFSCVFLEQEISKSREVNVLPTRSNYCLVYS